MPIYQAAAFEQLQLLSKNALINLDMLQCSMFGSESPILTKEHLVILNHYLSNILWTFETANNWLKRTKQTSELYGIFIQIKNIHKIALEMYKKAEQLYQEDFERNTKAEEIKQQYITAQESQQTFEDVMTKYMLSFETNAHPISIPINLSASKRKEELPEGIAPKKQESKKKRPRLSPRKQYMNVNQIKLIANAPFAQIYSIELNKLKEVCVNPESKEETIRSYFEEWRIQNTFGDNMDYSTLISQLEAESLLLD